MENKKLEVPKPSTGDFVHAGATIAVAGASAAATLLIGTPFVGINELFSFVFASPFEKRRQKWMEQVTEALLEIQQNRYATFEELSDNEEFQTLFIQASQIAVKTHLHEKHLLLKNSLTNFIADKAGFDIASAYLFVIERLQPLHLEIMRALLPVEYMQQFKSKENYFNYIRGIVTGVDDQVLLEVAINELQQQGLITNDLNTEGLDFYGDPYLNHIVSLFGKDFLSFIEDAR